MKDLKTYIREVPDFPKKGITFYDITTLFQNPDGLALTLEAMETFARSLNVDKVVGVESRGFILGGALADRLRKPFVTARKPGKLPSRTVSAEYELEYGTDSLEMHIDAINEGDRVLIVDDLIATGGTLEATAKLVEKLGGTVAGISAVIALEFLPYKDKLKGYEVNYLVSYDSE